MIIIEIICLKYLKLTNIMKFDFKRFVKGIKVGMFIFVISIISLFFNIYNGVNSENDLVPIFNIICYTVAILFETGFTEEVLCRGIIQNLLYETFGKNNRKGMLLSIVITSVIFGMSHFINYFSLDSGFIGVLMQVIVAIGIGLYFGAIYARCNNIWTVIFLHGLVDFAGMIQIGFWNIGSLSAEIANYDLTKLITFGIYFGLFLFVFRKSKFNECVESNN